jgi:hypothetical protein
LGIELFEHTRDIAAHIGIPKPQDSISRRLKPLRPRGVAPHFVLAPMLTAVNLDDQLCPQTSKIDNVAS